jgi:hypothetical protein
VGRTDDTCRDGCGDGGTCDGEKGTCIYDDFATTASPAALDPAANCTFLPEDAGEVTVWVNDFDFNDADLSEPYRFWVELVEGCSAACTDAWCAQ